MDARRVRVSIAVVAGLALVGLLLVGGSVLADSPPGRVNYQPVRAAGFSSPLMNIVPGTSQVITTNLGFNPDDMVVHLVIWDDTIGFNRRYYGGYEINGTWLGIHWQNLTSDTIEVYRQPDDTTADGVAVIVGKRPATPDHDSGWKDINPGQTLTVPHNVGVAPERLTVSLWFSSTARGIHHYAYGGLDVDGPQLHLGAWWQNLATDTLRVVRGLDDTDVEQVRVVVDQMDPPDYDSGFQPIAAGSELTFTHNRTCNPTGLLVRGVCYDDTGDRGINLAFSGGNHDSLIGYQGAHLERLTAKSVTFAREVDDQTCDEIVTYCTIMAGGFTHLPYLMSHFLTMP